jgi:hypothetical protein
MLVLRILALCIFRQTCILLFTPVTPEEISLAKLAGAYVSERNHSRIHETPASISAIQNDHLHPISAANPEINGPSIGLNVLPYLISVLLF